MNFVISRKIISFVAFLFIIATGNNSFCMNNEVKKEIEFFWGSKRPWSESVESAIECSIGLPREEKLDFGNLLLVKTEYAFYSKMYVIIGQYLKDKVILKNEKTGKEFVGKFIAGEDENSISLVDCNNIEKVIDKKTGDIIKK